MHEIRWFLAAAFTIGALGAADADTRIVSSVTITGLPFTGTVVHYPQTVTTYVRGEKTSVLVDGGTTSIYDAASKTVTIVDPTPPTYSVQTWDQSMAQGGPVGRMAESIKIDAKVDLKRQSETRTITGQLARRYTVSGHLTLSPKRTGTSGGGGMGRGGGRRGGGFPGGGRFPGGMFAQRGGGGRMPQMPTVDLTGDIWVAETQPLKWNTKDKDSLLPIVAQLMPPNPFVRPLTEKLAKENGIPLESDLALSVSVPAGDPPKVIHSAVEVTSVGDGSVDETAFQVPEGSKRTDPSAAEPIFDLPEGRSGRDAPPR